jgi:hypothetical protein
MTDTVPDKVVTIRGVSQLAKASIWPRGVRTQVGRLATGELVSAHFGHVIVDMTGISSK